jgi:hypothetical protein
VRHVVAHRDNDDHIWGTSLEVCGRRRHTATNGEGKGGLPNATRVSAPGARGVGRFLHCADVGWCRLWCSLGADSLLHLRLPSVSEDGPSLRPMENLDVHLPSGQHRHVSGRDCDSPGVDRSRCPVSRNQLGAAPNGTRRHPTTHCGSAAGRGCTDFASSAAGFRAASGLYQPLREAEILGSWTARPSNHWSPRPNRRRPKVSPRCGRLPA